MPGIRLHSWPSSFSCPTTSNHQITVPCCFAAQQQALIRSLCRVALLPNNKPSSEHCALLPYNKPSSDYWALLLCCPTTSLHQITGHCCFAVQQQALIRTLGTAALLPNKPSSEHWALLLCCPTTSPHQTTVHCCFAAQQQALIRPLCPTLSLLTLQLHSCTQTAVSFSGSVIQMWVDH